VLIGVASLIEGGGGAKVNNVVLQEQILIKGVGGGRLLDALAGWLCMSCLRVCGGIKLGRLARVVI
jgi:hypothetical protein